MTLYLSDEAHSTYVNDFEWRYGVRETPDGTQVIIQRGDEPRKTLELKYIPEGPNTEEHFRLESDEDQFDSRPAECEA